MTWTQLRARLRALWNWRRTESELDDEIAFHLSEEADDRAAGGLAPAQARLAAKRDFGNVALIRETTREVWGWGSAERLIQDVRFAVRSLRRNPGFAFVAILTLALGVGPTAAVFGVLDAVVLRPLPVPEPHRLVRVVPQMRGSRWILVYPLFEGLRDQQQSLDGIFAVSDQPNLKVRFDDSSAPEFLRGSSVSGAYFSTLRLTAAAGRVLTDQDDQIPGTPLDAGCAVVIGHDLWSRRFHNQHSVLGRKVQVRDVDCTIVGVAPVEFRSHQPGYVVDMWVPMRQVTSRRDLTNHYGAFFSGVMGRLKEGTSSSQAESQLTVLYQQLQAAEPVPPPDIPNKPIAPADVSIRLARGNHGLDALQREFEAPLLLIQVLVALVLLIAAASVAGLVLLRSASREAEFATRAALGARRMRIVRQLVTEAGVLAALGGLAGLALAVWSAPVLASFISLSWMPIAIDVRTDWRLLLLTLVATATAALVSGLVPACRLGRQPIISNIGSASRTTTSRFGLLIARSLVTVQLALSLVLVIGTGLLVTTMFRLSQVDPGFRPQNVLVLQIRHDSSSQAPDAPDRAARNAELLATYSRVESQLRALPGVEEASLSWLGLFGGSDQKLQLFDPTAPEDRYLAHVDRVSTRYFETAGMRLSRGRAFTAADREGSLRVAVVNETLRRERFGDGEAIGRRVVLDYPGERDRPVTIVGVVRDAKYNNLRETVTAPMIWVPLAQAPLRISSIMLRIQPGTEGSVARQATAALSATDENIMVRRTSTLSSIVERTTDRERLMLTLSAAFGVIGLIIAAVALYGTMAFAVARRTREIGLRMALGADQGRVVRSIVGDAFKLVCAATVVGVPGGLAAGSALQAFLYGVSPYDVTTLAIACFVLVTTAIVAALIPARRAAAIDPIAALRCE